jgi:hypothetical protein
VTGTHEPVPLPSIIAGSRANPDRLVDILLFLTLRELILEPHLAGLRLVRLSTAPFAFNLVHSPLP